MDFSVSGTSGKITYDLNGNLLNMLHKGVQPGNNTPITIDNLSYSYNTLSGITGNKLQTVTDNAPPPFGGTGGGPGMFGDFKDGTNTSTPDYVYDNNGNVVIDLNKNAKDLGNVVGANGIKYNYLDKPEQIRITGKGTITIVYSADGEKLQRIFAPEPSGATVTTTYINQYIYQESTAGGGLKLQQINFEEGRIRVITPTTQSNGLDALVVSGNMALPAYPGGGGGAGVWDYFITDHLGNVRMVLTEEIHEAQNTATMETTRAALEESIFGQAGGNNEVSTTRFDKPPGWTGNTSAKVSRTGTLSGRNIGPNVLQKVMAGDKVNAMVNYYHQGTAGGNSTTMVNNVLTSLVQAITGSGGTSGIVKGNTAGINSQLNGSAAFNTAVQPNGSNPAGNAPQAYITAIFFDERFNMIPAADGGVVQQQVAASVSGSSMTPLVLPADYKAPKNGYVYIYLSNQSNNDVYWDNFTVNIKQGQIVEENHYYSYGLKIATLSSKKLGDTYQGSLKNNYLYQGSFAELDEDIGWNDFALRNYDAQIGRWVQQDPYQEFASPYVGMGCDPANLIDPSGGSIDPIKGLSTTADKAITLSNVVVTASRTVSTVAPKVISNIAAKIIITTLMKAVSVINTTVNTAQVGDPNKNWGEGDVKQLARHAIEGRGDLNRSCDLCCLNAFASNLKDLYREKGAESYPTNDNMSTAVKPLVEMGLASNKLTVAPKLNGKRVTSQSHSGNYWKGDDGKPHFKYWSVESNVLETISGMTEDNGIGIFAVGLGAEYHSTIIVVVKDPKVIMSGVDGTKFIGSNSDPFYLFVEDNKGARIGTKSGVSNLINQYISGAKAYYKGDLCPGGKCYNNKNQNVGIDTNIYQLYNPFK
jgi:RHS repeat-associated protein